MQRPSRTLSENEKLLESMGFEYDATKYGYYHKVHKVIVSLDEARYMKEVPFRSKIAALIK